MTTKQSIPNKNTQFDQGAELRIPALAPLNATNVCTPPRQPIQAAAPGEAESFLRVLDTAFSIDGYDFRQLHRDGSVALFEKRKPNHSRPSYEVIIIQRKAAGDVFGKEMPAREVMPRPEDWGTFAWTEVTLEKARQRFNALVEQQKEGGF